jgi:hypothetical protein
VYDVGYTDDPDLFSTETKKRKGTGYPRAESKAGGRITNVFFSSSVLTIRKIIASKRARWNKLAVEETITQVL